MGRLDIGINLMMYRYVRLLDHFTNEDGKVSNKPPDLYYIWDLQRNVEVEVEISQKPMDTEIST